MKDSSLKKHIIVFLAIALSLTTMILSAQANSISESSTDTNALNTQETRLKAGGLLYDNWPKIAKAKLTGEHPLYPTSSKKKGTSTWRCKECHGWDYIGNMGRYSKGSHFTGIKGLLDISGKQSETIYKELTNSKDNHDFSLWLNKEQLNSLALFISKGQFDYSSALDSKSEITGDVKNGSKKYKSYCLECHGARGNAIDFKGKKDGIQGVGWLANDNPQETLHKIRWGHPGTSMPSAIVNNKLKNSDTIDILIYSRTLK